MGAANTCLPEHWISLGDDRAMRLPLLQKEELNNEEGWHAEDVANSISTFVARLVTYFMICILI